MSESESVQFRQYAREAMSWADEAKSREEEIKLIELACLFTHVSVASERTRLH
jgi:hypothetical protein